MNQLIRNRFWRWSGVVVLTFALIIVTVFTYTAHNSTAYAGTLTNSGKHGTIPSRSAPISLGGTVDWSKLPKVTHTTALPALPAMPIHDALTPAAREAYYQAVAQHKIALPQAKVLPLPTAPVSAAQIAQNAANSTNPNFDTCGYAILPCPVHSWTGLTAQQESVPSNGATPTIASNPTYVMQGTDSVFAVYNFNGNLLYGPTSSFAFFAPIWHSGDALTKPQMYWDATRLHWIIIEDEYTYPSVSGVPNSYLDIAISKGQDGVISTPAQWYLYQLNYTSIIGTSIGGAHSFCDNSKLGSDFWGLWISCTAFSSSTENFVGNAIFGLSKNALYAGSTNTTIYYWENIPNGFGKSAFVLNPANEDGTPDAEFMITTDDGYGSTHSDLITAAFTDTRGLATAPQTAPHLTYVITTLPVAYAYPVAARQPNAGSIILETSMSEIEYKGGNLYFAMTTATSAGSDGIYWAEIQPQLSPLDPVHPQNQQIQAPLIRQDTIWGYGASTDAYTPTLVGSSEDDVTLTYNISSETIYPSIIYTGRRATDAVNLMGEGTNSASIISGATEISQFDYYSACSLDTNLTSRGLIWCTSQYGGADGFDTWVFALEVE